VEGRGWGGDYWRTHRFTVLEIETSVEKGSTDTHKTSRKGSGGSRKSGAEIDGSEIGKSRIPASRSTDIRRRIVAHVV